MGALLASAAALCPSVARGQVTDIVVVPVGKGKALYRTSLVARAIVNRLNRPGKKKKAKLFYSLPGVQPARRALKRQAAKLLRKARKNYQNMEFEKLEDSTKKALKIYKTLLKHDEGRAGYIECKHILAASALAEGKSQKAFKAMNDAILFDSQPPPKKHFNPQVQKLHGQVLSDPPAVGKVNMQTSPRALVWFNNQFRGPARGTIKIRAGLYLVRFFLPGHTMYQRWIRVKPHESRDLDAALARDSSPEPDLITSLRTESREESPGTSIAQLSLDTGASQVIVVTASKKCAKKKCAIYMRWAADDEWKRRKKAVYKGKSRAVALKLLGKRKRRRVAARTTRPRATHPAAITPIAPVGVQTCTMDSQCGFKETCKNGRCVKPDSVTRKWWFWTLIGVAVAGATVAIVVPVTAPDNPVIEVK